MSVQRSLMEEEREEMAVHDVELHEALEEAVEQLLSSDDGGPLGENEVCAAAIDPARTAGSLRRRHRPGAGAVVDQAGKIHLGTPASNTCIHIDNLRCDFG